MMTGRMTHIQNFISVATGGYSFAIDKVSVKGIRTRSRLKDFLYQLGIPQTEVVQEDMRRVLEGQPPKHFVHAQKLAHRFRDRLNIPDLKEHPALDFEPGFCHVGDIVEDILQQMDSDEASDPYELDGHACRNQQSAFYESPEWQSRAKVARSIDGLECRSCHRNDCELQVHHIQPIFSVHSKKFFKNFDVTRMRTLCKSCHMDLHKGVIKDANGFHSASNEARQDAQARREKRYAQHDQARECLWCQRFEWPGSPEWLMERMQEQYDTGDRLPF